MIPFECSICESRELIITAGPAGWELECGQGHLLVPMPGTQIVVKSR